MDLVHDRGSMDPVQSWGPWTPGPCFVLTHLYMYFHCSCAHRLLIKCNVDYPSLDLYAHVVGFRLPEGEESRANQGGVRIGYGKPGKSWNLKNFIFQAWKVMELNCPP